MDPRTRRVEPGSSHNPPLSANGLLLTRGSADRALMSQKTFERRRAPRRRVDLPAGLKISTYGKSGSPRTFAAKLIDANEGGVGVEMFVPLVEGSIVSVDGELSIPELSLNVHGQARVTYCRCENGGTFRVGLAYEEMSYRKTA